MIKYTLCCENKHTFESWFQNSSSYEMLEKTGNLSCPICNSNKVERAIVAPNVGKKSSQKSEHNSNQNLPSVAKNHNHDIDANKLSLSEDVARIKTELKAIRDKFLSNAEYVGDKFPEKAREIYYSQTQNNAASSNNKSPNNKRNNYKSNPNQPTNIYGEAKIDEIKSLVEEGIPIMPIPSLPDEVSN